MIVLPNGVYRYLSRIKSGMKTLADDAGSAAGPVRLAAGYAGQQVDAGTNPFEEIDIVPLTGGTELGSLELPKEIWEVSSALRIKVQGSLNLQNNSRAGFYVYLDPQAPYIIELETLTNTTGSQKTYGFTLETELICRSVGVSGDVTSDTRLIMGYRDEGLPAASAVTAPSFATATIDMTQDTELRLVAYWNLANGGYIVVNSYDVTIESLIV